MTLIHEFASLVCAVLLSLVLYFVIKIYSITVENQEPRVEMDQAQQPVAAGRRRITTRIDSKSKNLHIQGNCQVPREHDERQGY